MILIGITPLTPAPKLFESLKSQEVTSRSIFNQQHLHHFMPLVLLYGHVVFRMALPMCGAKQVLTRIPDKLALLTGEKRHRSPKSISPYAVA